MSTTISVLGGVGLFSTSLTFRASSSGEGLQRIRPSSLFYDRHRVPISEPSPGPEPQRKRVTPERNPSVSKRNQTAFGGRGSRLFALP
jgi:hypothetical protein